MPGDVEMQDPPAIVADDKEAVEDAEGDRGHGEEVHGRNRFPVIRKKRTPAPGWLGISRRPLHPAGETVETQHDASEPQFQESPRGGTSSIPTRTGTRASRRACQKARGLACLACASVPRVADEAPSLQQ